MNQTSFNEKAFAALGPTLFSFPNRVDHYPTFPESASKRHCKLEQDVLLRFGKELEIEDLPFLHAKNLARALISITLQQFNITLSNCRLSQLE